MKALSIAALAAGGTDPSGAVSTVEAYNPANNTWTTVPMLPTARGWMDSDVVNGVMYAIGSECCAHFLTVDVFTPAQ
jgi:hypothetical protein